MVNKNILLLTAVIIYLFPIIYISVYYNNNNSISSIISNEKGKIYNIVFYVINGYSNNTI
jgi:branched-subunit amino acid permease